MIHRVAVHRTSDGLNVILPPEIVENLGVKDADALYVVETDGGVLLTPLDPEFFEAMERGNAKYANAFRELAKYDSHTDPG